MLRNGTRAVPEIPAGGGGGFTNTYSFVFDGVDDRVQLASDFTESGTFTVSFWMKPAAAGSPSGKIYPLGTFPGNSNYVKLDQIGVMWLRLGGANAIFNEAVVGGGSNNLVLNNWQHIAFIRDSSNVIRCYRNGSSFGGTVTNSNTLTLNSFGRIITNTFGFEGNLDEIALFQTDETANLSTLSSSPTVDLADLSPTVWLRNGDNGAYKSPQWLIPNNKNKDKVSNYSLDFDGVDDYISVSDNSIGQTQNISYSIWVNLNVTTRQYIIGNQNSSNGGCGLQIESGDVLVFQMADGGNDSFFNSRVTNFSTYAPINTWNHILATWDGTDSKIYINGVLRNTWSPTLPYTISGYDATFNIGWRNAGFSLMTNGKLDELALFDSAVSIGDVWDGSGQPIDVSAVSGLTNNWRMGEEATFSTNWTIPDQVGSNDGTSANMTIEDRVGDAPNSENNALSYNMDEVDRVTDVPS